MISPKIKDRILKELVDTGVNSQLNIRNAKSDFNIETDYLEIILDQFENLGFIEQRKMLGGGVMIRLSATAFDFIQKGGFTAEVALEKAALDKLQLEIESLKESYPDKAGLFTSTLANIATVAGLFMR